MRTFEVPADKAGCVRARKALAAAVTSSTA